MSAECCQVPHLSRLPGPGLGCPCLHLHAAAQPTGPFIQQHLAISTCSGPAQPQDQDLSPKLSSGQHPTFVQGLVGHPVDVSAAALGHQPLHDHVHAALAI